MNYTGSVLSMSSVGGNVCVCVGQKEATTVPLSTCLNCKFPLSVQYIDIFSVLLNHDDHGIS